MKVTLTIRLEGPPGVLEALIEGLLQVLNDASQGKVRWSISRKEDRGETAHQS